MWTYFQKDGALLDPGSQLVGRGYSGHLAGLNNPAMEDDAGIGPIPAGHWTIGAAHNSPHTGPVTMDLNPISPFNAHGRTLFRMHGDNRLLNHTASHGCIIMARAIRERVAASSDHTLLVMACGVDDMP